MEVRSVRTPKPERAQCGPRNPLRCGEGVGRQGTSEVPSGHTSESFSTLLLEKAAVVCTPGNGFGAHGEGYVRFALSVDVSRLEEAVERIGKVL